MNNSDLKIIKERNERAIDYIERVILYHLKQYNQRQIEVDLKIVTMILKGE